MVQSRDLERGLAVKYSLQRAWVYDKMQLKPPLLQSCSSQYFRFISGAAGVKQVGKEELSAGFPEVL